MTPPALAKGSNHQTRAQRQAKRATVVGNPMFSNSPDGDGEVVGAACEGSLGLDDLDTVDYEQIMQYFDNLKVGGE